MRLRLLAVVSLLPAAALALPPSFVGTPSVASTFGHQVLVTWNTSITATSQIAWGPASVASFSAYPNVDAPLVLVGTAHSRTLRRLAPGTWFMRVRSTNGTDVIDSAELSVTIDPNDTPLADAALDGTVNAIVARNGTFYVGGSFTRRFDLTGSAFVATRAAGLHPPHFPEVAGQVNAIVPDGVGNFILCGGFRYVGGQVHQGIARLLPDGQLDPTLTLGTDGVVTDCAVSGTTLYVVGSFSFFGGQSRGRGAAVDLSSNTLLPWDPGLPFTALSVATDGTTVWVGGSFLTPRVRLAAFDATTAALRAFQADVDNDVLDLQVSNTTLYLGGRFSTVAGAARTRLAAVDAATGALRTFAPVIVGNEVDTIEPSGGLLYIGGSFTTVEGTARNSIAAVDGLTGALQAFNPALSANATVYRLVVDGSELFIGGSFSSVAGMTRRNAAALTLATQALTSFNPDLSGPARAFEVLSTGDVLVGGAFGGGNNSAAASRFLRADAVTGAFTVGPSYSGTIFAMAAAENELYTTGFFTTVGGQARSNVASLTLPAAAVTPWAPVVDQSTHGVGVGPDATIYLGGDFTHVNGITRNFAAAVAPDGGLLAWDPAPNGSVESMHLGNDAVFLGGTFTQLGGGAHARIGAVDFAGNVLPWNAGANNTVYAIQSTPTAVYVGGVMSQCLGSNRGFGCSFNGSGALLPWNPRTDAQVSSITAGSGAVMVAGSFTQPRSLLVVVNDTTGTQGMNSLEFTSPGSVRAAALDCTTNRLAIGGSFLHIGASSGGGFLIVDGAQACAAQVGRITLVDAGVPDAGTLDAGTVDAGFDAGIDAGAVDAGDVDAGLVDAGEVDAGEMDAGTDAGVPDAGAGDAGSEDAGTEDAGVDHGPYVVGCACSSASAWQLVLVAAVALLRRRRQR